MAGGSVERDYITETSAVAVGKGVINLRFGKAGAVAGSAPVGTVFVGADPASLRLRPDSDITQMTPGVTGTLGSPVLLLDYGVQGRRIGHERVVALSNIQGNVIRHGTRQRRARGGDGQHRDMALQLGIAQADRASVRDHPS